MPLRCVVCNKKIPSIFLKINECKCGKIVCSQHKSEASHACTFDWKSHGCKELSNKLIISTDSTKGLQKI